MDESHITEKLRKLKNRYKHVLLLERMTRFLFWSSLFTIAILIIMKILGYETPLIFYSLIPLALALILPSILFLTEKVPLVRIALLTDDRLQLRERLSTIIEWIEQQKKRTLMYKGLLRDTALNVEGIQPEKIFPLRFPKRYRLIAVTMPVVCALILTPTWALIKLAPSRDEMKSIIISSQKIEKNVTDIEKRISIDMKDKLEIKKKTDEIKKLVKNPHKIDKTRAIAKISDLKDRLKEKRMQLAEDKSVLDKLTQAVSSKKGGSGAQSASQKMKEMAEQLQKGEPDKSELDKIKAELSRAKESLDPENKISKDIDDALKSIAKGDMASASQKLDELAQSLSKMESG